MSVFACCVRRVSFRIFIADGLPGASSRFGCTAQHLAEQVDRVKRPGRTVFRQSPYGVERKVSPGMSLLSWAMLLMMLCGY